MGHARSFGGARTRLQWFGWGGVLEPWASSDFVGKFWEILELAAKFWESSTGNSGKICDFCIRRHHSRVHQSRPEERGYLSHVTQPRSRINVSCSRAGHKGGTGGRDFDFSKYVATLLLTIRGYCRLRLTLYYILHQIPIIARMEGSSGVKNPGIPGKSQLCNFC